MHARRTTVASAARAVGILARLATSTRRLQLLECFSQAGRADVQRVVGEEVEVGRTSTFELTCDAGTLGALSAGDLDRYRVLAHLLLSCFAAASQRDLQNCSLLPISCSLTFEFSAQK